MLARISLRERGKKGGLRSARCYEANGTYTAGDNDGGDNINIIMGQRRGDVTSGPLRPEDTARARARAIVPIQVMKYARYGRRHA